jgi:hypothetical protein
VLDMSDYHVHAVYDPAVFAQPNLTGLRPLRGPASPIHG